MADATWGDIFEAFMGTGRKDAAGREIGYVVGLRDNGTDFAAWVQNARLVNGQWKEFGVQQPSKSFVNQERATTWAYATARARIAKIIAA